MTLMMRVLSAVLMASFLALPPAVAQDRRALIMERTYEGLSIEVREVIQEQLARKGFYNGAIDGVFGPKTLTGLLDLCDCANPSVCAGLTNADAVVAYFNDLLSQRLSCTTPPPGDAPEEARQIARLYMPQQCGSYESGTLSSSTWFSGGEGGVIELKNPKDIAGLPAIMFDGTVISEGYREPAGQIMVIESTFRDPMTGTKQPVIVIVRPEGVSLYAPCL